MIKINDRVKITNLQGSGLEKYELEFLGETGKIVYIDTGDNELPYSVQLDKINSSFYLHSCHFEVVGV